MERRAAKEGSGTRRRESIRKSKGDGDAMAGAIKQSKDQKALGKKLKAQARQSVMDGHSARFRQKFTLEDAIGPHASSLEASRRVTNGIPLGCPRFLPVHAVYCVQTLKGGPMQTALPP